MTKIDLTTPGSSFPERYDQPTALFLSDDHAVYWLGVPEDSAFRCNTYLIVDGNEAVVVDPGGAQSYDFILERVRQVLPVERVKAVLLCHQDPDVAASLVKWLQQKPEPWVITSNRTNILLPYYGAENYTCININETPNYQFSSGKKLRFVEAPFLHFPGAFTTIDEVSGFLFSGDIWAAVDMDWRLVVENFRTHELKMSLFHVDYMASNLACRGFLRNLGSFVPEAILPQHGSVIPKYFVPNAMEYLKKLKCGLDLIYSGLK